MMFDKFQYLVNEAVTASTTLVSYIVPTNFYCEESTPYLEVKLITNGNPETIYLLDLDPNTVGTPSEQGEAEKVIKQVQSILTAVAALRKSRALTKSMLVRDLPGLTSYLGETV